MPARIPKAWESRTPVPTVTLTFDRPPSVNRLTRNVGAAERDMIYARSGKIVSRVKTADYVQWVNVALVQIAQQRPGCVRGTFHLEIIAERGSLLADLGNIEKATADILKTAGVIEDDRFCVSQFKKWRGRGTSMVVRVTQSVGE